MDTILDINKITITKSDNTIRITSELYWQEFTPSCLDKYKEPRQNILIYAPKWGNDPYDIISWYPTRWESLERSQDACFSTSYTDEELYKGTFTHFVVIVKPKPY